MAYPQGICTTQFLSSSPWPFSHANTLCRSFIPVSPSAYPIVPLRFSFYNFSSRDSIQVVSLLVKAFMFFSPIKGLVLVPVTVVTFQVLVFIHSSSGLASPYYLKDMASLQPYISLNVNGIQSAPKRRAIFSMLRNGGYDFAFLQDSHCTSELEMLWQTEWGGAMYCSNGRSNSRGGLDTPAKKLRHQNITAD